MEECLEVEVDGVNHHLGLMVIKVVLLMEATVVHQEEAVALEEGMVVHHLLE